MYMYTYLAWSLGFTYTPIYSPNPRGKEMLKLL